MANIKGITIQLDGDTTKLTEALKNVNKEIRGTQSDLRELNKLLKIDPGNTYLLEQGNDIAADEVYCEVTDQSAFDAF